ncbi:MAG: dihydrolipoyl dehydrogenase [Alphaproteobacteria bacterium]
MADSFDVVVIGGGPGGYIAAIRAAQLGMTVACVEKEETLGGTCTNVGCIPSKALLHASHLYEQAQTGFAGFGISTGELAIDVPKMIAAKAEIVSGNVKGIDFLFKKNKVERILGKGRIASQGKVAVVGEGGERMLDVRNIIIATGSEVMPLPGVEVDEKRIVSSTGALDLTKVPKHLIVIGGGYIGLEMGVVWRRLGAEVTVVEYLDSILPNMDGEIAKMMDRILRKKGFKIRTGLKVTGAATTKAGASITVEPAKGGDAETIEGDIVLLSIGRRPYTAGLGLEDVGVKLDERGRIAIDDHFRTSVPGIYAIGDVVRGPMLAHKAEDEGGVCAEIIAGQAGHIDYDAIPAVVYTWPEAATVGKTEEELKKAGIAYKVGKFPFSANGRARAMHESDGFVKILADAKTDRVLGCHILGPEAGTMIAEVALGMEFGAAAEDIARTCHAHPTLNEAVREAALAVDGRALNI